jgi:hypothetical protein
MTRLKGFALLFVVAKAQVDAHWVDWLNYYNNAALFYSPTLLV